MPEPPKVRPPEQGRTVRVWDLPIRLFHWILVALVLLSFVTGQIGGNALEFHELSGFTILTLVLFRILWGIVGSTYARFSGFVRGFEPARAYARTLLRGRPSFYPGHNPLGGWMILALLLCLLIQASTGLFANDDVMLEGPLAKLVSKATSDLLTRLHKINFYILLALVALHVFAALYYLWAKRENLVTPLFTGRKRLPEGERAEELRGGPLWLAALVLTACGLAVWLLVR